MPARRVPEFPAPTDSPALCPPLRIAINAINFENIDTDGNGHIDRAEWMEYVTREARAHGERPMLKLIQLLKKRINDLWIP